MEKNEPPLSSSDENHPKPVQVCEEILVHNGGKSNGYFKIIATFAKFFFEEAKKHGTHQAYIRAYVAQTQARIIV